MSNPVYTRKIGPWDYEVYQVGPKHFEIKAGHNWIEANATYDNWPNPPNKKWGKLETAIKYIDRKEKAYKIQREVIEEEQNLKDENKRLKRRVKQLEAKLKE